MKIVIGIVLISLVLLGLIAYLVLMLNAREMIFCGDVQNQTGTSASVTRVYTTDLSANETLSEIIVKMNESQDGSVAVEDLTTVLAQYQNIIYAPVFTVDIQQVDTATYIINGTVYNGLDANGNEAEPDYRYRDMNLGTVVTDGVIIAAFILGFPANETVIPVMLMCYLSTGTLTEYSSISQLGDILADHGWTIHTALAVSVLCMFHFPCGTTCLTVQKETGSLKWTALAFILPALTGLLLCLIINIIFS